MGKKIPYTKEIGDEICLQIATSTFGLEKLIAINPHWPKKDKIFAWILEEKSFAESYARAKKFQVEALMDELLEIADDSSKDIIETDKGFKYDHEHINRARLKVDTRKWIASKLVPHLYGDKLITETKTDTKEIEADRELIHRCSKT